MIAGVLLTDYGFGVGHRFARLSIIGNVPEMRYDAEQETRVIYESRPKHRTS